MGLGILDVSIFLAFVVAVITFGILMSRHEKDSESYFLAGRGLSWWLIGFSLIAANISAEQFVGMSGAAAKDMVGLAIASYEWIAAITLVVVAFFFLPTFLRSGIYTIPEFLEYRYDSRARLIMSVLMVVTLVCVNTTTGIYVGAKALEPLFAGQTILGLKVDIRALAWIVGIGAAVYVAAGGLKACVWTDLFWGVGLIAGGAIVMVLAFMALDKPQDFRIDPASVAQSIGTDESASLAQKFEVLKEKKMHMVLPADNPEIPWTALILGIWIPNFYYWGLNQYIMQRALGARSLADGQRGVVFAAGLKLIIPFIVCIPGVIAFSLYHTKMQEKASENINKKTLSRFDEVRTTPKTTAELFNFNGDFAKLYPAKAKEILLFNSEAAGAAIPPAAEMARLPEMLIADFSRKDPAFAKKAEAIEAINESAGTDSDRRELGLADLNAEAVHLAGKSGRRQVQTELVGYDYDSAFPTLVANLSPVGLRGFVVAALMGAVVSTLAAMLNAASTIFTMDVYKQYLHRNASQGNLVLVGRCCVPVAVLVGCIFAPELADPRFQGAFHFIQEFQGYISPGILTVFLFGLFIPRTPRFAGIVGLVLSPIVYGALHFFAGGQIAFLNRMAITVGALAAVLAILTLIAPLREPVTLPIQTKIELESSRAAKVFGLLVVLATMALYVIFW